MNILIPHHWLLEHLETKATPEQIRKQLSLAGPSVERIQEKEGETVYDIEVTTNRVDSMSVRGIAREAAVILDHAKIPAQLKPLHLMKFSQLQPTTTQLLPLPKISHQLAAVKRITTVVLSQIKPTATPEWMAKRLRQIDQNVHWAAIDITNYVTHELGHPCHAFDYDKMMNLGGKIIIDIAKKNESFTTLDGERYTTVGGEVIFRAQDGTIIDLPAIKGTLNTAVDQNTKNILFWIENLDAKKVRFSSMTHDIRTVAAELNERNVDPHLAEPTFSFALKLYQQIIGAKIASNLYDYFPHPQSMKTITVPLAVFQRYLGFSLDQKIIISILTKLGCKVTQEKQQLLISPPTYRQDLAIPVDFVEEVARIYGYHNIPNKIMGGTLPLKRPDDAYFDLEEKIKNFLSLVGLQEVYTYSLVSEKQALKSGYQLKDHLKLANPLTEDKVYLRRSLLPSLNQVIAENPTSTDLELFEVAKIYRPTGQETQLPQEQMKLAFSFRSNYRRARGIIEGLLDYLFVEDYQFITNKNNTQAEIIAFKKQKHHSLGIINASNITLPASSIGLINAELDLNSLSQVAQSQPHYQPLAKTMPLIEDLTFEIAKNTKIGDLIAAIKQTSPLIHQVELKDVYQQRYSFRLTYLDPQNNLAAPDIMPIRQKIVHRVKQRFPAELVGKV